MFFLGFFFFLSLSRNRRVLVSLFLYFHTFLMSVGNDPLVVLVARFLVDVEGGCRGHIK